MEHEENTPGFVAHRVRKWADLKLQVGQSHFLGSFAHSGPIFCIIRAK